jgi:transmembrane sensor
VQHVCNTSRDLSRLRVGAHVTPEDWIALDRYVAGEGPPEEREATRLRIQASPNLAAIVDAMRSARRGPGNSSADAPNATAAWSSVSATLGFEPSSRRGRPPRAPLSLMSSPRRRRFSAGRLAGVAAAAVLIAGASLVSWQALRTTSHARTESPPAIRAEYQTARGERATVELRDGTRVVLAPETKLRIASNDRQVYLNGEAAFTVTHDSTRPFSVIAAKGTEIRDIGTQFDVRAYPEERTVRVVVAQGSVSLRGAATEPVILPRGALGIVDSAAVRVTRGVTTDRYLGWIQGNLTFTNARMADVAAELTRWFDLDVRLGSDKIADVRLTLAVNDAPADVTLEVIARAIDARVVRTGQSATFFPNTREGPRE